MPLFSYFFVVGSLLTGLLIFASTVTPSSGPPIRVSQTVGLPEPYRAPAIAVEVAKPVVALGEPRIAVVTVKPLVKAERPAIRKNTQIRVSSEISTRGRYAAYLPPEYERDPTP